MNRVQHQPNWTELKGRMRADAGQPTDDDVTVIGRKKDELSGILRQDVS